MALNTAALSTIAAGSRLYLDTNVWIYALEGFAQHAQVLAQLFARVDAGQLTAVTSELTLAEALVKPFASGRDDLRQVYLDTLRSGGSLVVAAVSREILIDAARLRGQHPALKLPDAIHAATAQAHGVEFFVTNDARFSALSSVQIVLVQAQLPPDS
jgi:predicted nucleic acid-binding protein